MTSLLALVASTAQVLRTRQRADVLNIDAAQLIAVVLATGSLLLATFLAARVVGLGRQVSASDLAVHVTASALDVSVQVTIRTLFHVTRCLAGVWITCASEGDFNGRRAQYCDKVRSAISLKCLLGWPHFKRFEQILSQVGTGSVQLSLFSVNSVWPQQHIVTFSGVKEQGSQSSG